MKHEEQGSDMNERQGNSTAIWTAVAILGAAAAAFFITKKFIKGEKIMDAASLLDAADKAANNLDAILNAEGRQTAS